MLKSMFNNPLGVAREMDRLFDSMASSQPFGFAPTVRAHASYPAVNLWETEASFHAEAELPGMTMDDIEVLVTSDQLCLKGHRAIDIPDEASALRRERPMGAFERTISLPTAVDTDRVEARLSNGVLSITLPKIPECTPHKVEVKTIT